MYKFHLTQDYRATPAAVVEYSMGRFEECAEYMPNVERIQILSRERTAPHIEKLNAEVFAESQIPKIAQPFMKKSDLHWKEFYTIDYEKNTVSWVVEPPVFPDAVECHGTSYFNVKGDGCEMVLEGMLDIGIPKQYRLTAKLFKPVISVVEPFVAKMVNSNLKKYFKALSDAMDREAAAVK